MTTTENPVATTAAVDWVTLSTPEFVGWSRLVDLEIPYPLSTGDVPYVDAPESDAVRRLLRERGLDDSPVLEAARVALAAPRLVVYAVRIDADGREAKYVAVAGRDDEHAVLVLLDDRSTSVRTIADTELAAGVVGSLPHITALHFPGVEVAAAQLHAIDDVVEAGETPRTVRGQMHQVGLPSELIAAHERIPRDSVLPTGVLGALGGSAAGANGALRHATRGANWREFPDGAVLQVERGRRHGEQVVLVVPYSVDTLFRAAVDAVASSYEPG